MRKHKKVVDPPDSRRPKTPCPCSFPLQRLIQSYVSVWYTYCAHMHSCPLLALVPAMLSLKYTGSAT